MKKYFSDKYVYIAILWFFALIGSQFYVFSSGSIQPGNIPLLLIIAFSVFKVKKLKNIDIDIIKYLLFFLVYSLTVNLIWSIIEQDTQFIFSSLFWLFGFLVLISGIIDFNSSKVVSFVKSSAFLGIISLLVFWFFGLGEPTSPPRYNAYFNDPNQMAFWVLCVFSVYFYLIPKGSKWLVAILLMLSVVLVFATMSRSALLGLVFSTIGVVIRFQGLGAKSSLSNKIFYIVSSLIVFVPTFLYFSKSNAYNNLVTRLLTSDFGSQAEIRGYTRILEYPEYLFLGAGQGLDSRFESAYEIHSSWAALLFYYGILGLFIFLIFIMKIFMRLDIAGKFVFLGPLVYGFSTYGLRSPIFWFFVAAAVYASKINNKSISPTKGSQF
jgi:hypothetical protein